VGNGVINKPKDVGADKNGNQVAVKCNESTGSNSSSPIKGNTVPKSSLVLRKVQFMKKPGSKALGFSIVGKNLIQLLLRQVQIIYLKIFIKIKI
jgi:hypothetical protein